MKEVTARLFDEFATSYRRGESPDVRAYLELAGDDREALADLIDRFLQAVPARVPTEEEIVLVQARLEQEPPLLVLRRRRKLSRGAVVDALVKTLALNPKKRDKVARYYHELEVGLLPVKPVSAKVWAALDGFLEANVRVLAGLRPPPLAGAAPRYRRVPDDTRIFSRTAAPESAVDDVLSLEAEPPPPEPPERDEIDELFTGTP